MISEFTTTYTMDIGSYHLDLSAIVYHSDTVYYDTNLFYRQRPFTTFGAEAAYHLNFHLTLSMWGRNLTDAAYLNGELIKGYGTTAGYAPPRTAKISASYEF